MGYVNNGTKKLLIGGERKKSSSGSTINVVNPATEEVITQIYAAEKEDIDLAVKSAKDALESKDWTGMTPTGREALLTKIAEIIEENTDELAVLETLDIGSPLSGSQFSVKAAADTFRYYAEWPTKIYDTTQPSNL